MAITKLLRLKERKSGNRAGHLKHNLCYICRPEKTMQGTYIGGTAGHTWEMAYRSMLRNKAYWEKEDGTQGFHYVISFPPDERITPGQCLAFAEEFAAELLREDYLYLIAVHNDTGHLHAHVTFDSVGVTTGKKFHSPRGDWEKRIQPITDRLCQKYGFAVLEPDQKTGKTYGEWKHEQDQKKLGKEQAGYSWYDIIRDDIDEAIEYSDTYEAFLSYLREHGYQVRSGKYLSLKPDGRKQAVRTSRLGMGYTKEELLERIQNKEYGEVLDYRMATYGSRREMRNIICARIQKSPGWKMPEYQKQFYRRWNQTFFIRKPEYRKLSWVANRKEILEVTRLADVIRYLVEHDIESVDDLQERKEELFREKKYLMEQKRITSTRIRKSGAFVALRKYERFMKNMEGLPEAYEKAEELLSEVERYGTLEEVRSRYKNLKEKQKEYRMTEKDLNQELKILSDAEKDQELNLGRTEIKRSRKLTE